MDMWLSVMRLSDNEFALSTLVNLKTRSGKIYMAFVKPFHKFVAKYCLRQALKRGACNLLNNQTEDSIR